MANKADVRNWIKLHLLLDCATVSYRHLFVKAWREKYGREWDKDDSKLIFEHKQLKKMQKIQHDMVEEGDVDLWDISLLQELLTVKNFLNLPSHHTTRIAKIRSIRNEVAHHATKIILDDQFNDMWDDVTNILVEFGECNAKLEKLKIVTRVGGLEFMPGNEDIDEESIVKVGQLKVKGNDELSNGKYLEAIRTFTEGIVLPKLPATDRAILYLSRCNARLNGCKKEPAADIRTELFRLGGDFQLRDAKQDAKKVLKLWPDWWRGYFCLGKVYVEMGKLIKAQSILSEALVKEPQKQEVIDILNTISAKLGLNGVMHIDLESIAKSKAEFVLDLGEGAALNSYQVILKTVLDLCVTYDVTELESFRDIQHGHQSRIALEYKLAAQFYRKASDRGNAEGKFHLGQMILNGEGVQKDVGMGLDLLKKVTEQPSKINNLPNVGVAEALFLIGLCYEVGNGVPLNLAKVKNFYQRSSDHGCSKATNTLGLMFEFGIPNKIPDLKKAEQLYIAAIESEVLPETDAMLNLARLCEQNDLIESALNWCHCAKAAQCRLPLLQNMIERLQKKLQECSGSSVDLEEANGMSSLDGKDWNELKSLCHQTSFRGQSRFNSLQLENCLLTSTYGKRLKEAKQHLLAAIDVLTKEIQSVSNPSLEVLKKFITFFSKGVRIEFRICELPALQHRQAISIICKLLKQKTSFDEEARTCYVALEGLKPTSVNLVTFLDECVTAYPKNSFFLRHHARVRMIQHSYKCAVNDINAAKKLEPRNVDILFERAAILRFAVPSTKLQAAIDAHKEFISRAPDDHLDLPDAYYGLAQLTFLGLDTCRSGKLGADDVRNRLRDCWAEAKKNYDVGLSLEKKQLLVPFKSYTKAVTEFVLALTMGLAPIPLPATVSETTEAETSSGAELNPKLNDPNRVTQIKQHRAWLRDCRKNVSSASDYLAFANQTDRPKIPICIIKLKAILLRNMHTAEDTVYEGHTLDATVIDEVGFSTRSVVLLIEDNDGSVERCLLHNWLTFHDRTTILEQFLPGRKMSIINPSVRIAGDGKRVVFVDDQNAVKPLILIPKMCRYCCKPDVGNSCTKCKKAYYCDRACQLCDWNDLNHKFICRPNRN